MQKEQEKKKRGTSPRAGDLFNHPHGVFVLLIFKVSEVTTLGRNEFFDLYHVVPHEVQYFGTTVGVSQRVVLPQIIGVGRGTHQGRTTEYSAVGELKLHIFPLRSGFSNDYAGVLPKIVSCPHCNKRLEPDIYLTVLCIRKGQDRFIIF